MIAALYNLLLLLLAPLFVAWFGLRDLRRGRLRAGWDERLGHLPLALVSACAGREVLWIHAVSVGETMAAKPLLAALRQLRPRAVIVLSQITETGREVALGARADGVFYLPLDVPPVIDRVLRQLRPRLLVTIDTELWPNLMWVCHRRGVRTAVTNGRISDRSWRRIQRLHLTWLYRFTLAHVDRLYMQSDLDAGRVIALGATPDRVSVTGNLKIDERLPTVDAARLAWWHTTLGLDPAAPVLLGGSTAPGEEAALLATWRALRATHPGLRLVLVPRAIQRADEIAALVAAAGATAVRRSELPRRSAESLAGEAVIVVDTIGELSELYALATVAFVGRSLVPLGGSNVLQAAGQGKVVLTGPYVNNVRDSVALLVAEGVAEFVADEAALTAAAGRWLAADEQRATVGARALAVMAANRGATARTAAAVVELLDG